MRRWFEDACGGLKWTPETFWRCTLSEFFMTIEGNNRANRSGVEPLTREEFEELEARYA